MEWRDVEVLRRRRLYVTAEVKKDAVEHLARLGLATSFALVVGMAEGARVSAAKGDFRFPFRYAVYNVLPSFVGGKVSAVNVASSMTSAPPLRMCPQAAAHVANLRALRTAVAGCTVLSILFQVSLAGGRGAQAYEQAVADGREVPIVAAGSALYAAGRDIGSVVRLSGAWGLEPALVSTERGSCAEPVLPVVVAAHSRPPDVSGYPDVSAALPAEARWAVAKASPRPSYYRLDPRRLFCLEAWRPVTSQVAQASRSDGAGLAAVLVEADTVSSGEPQWLLSSAADVSGDSRSDRPGCLSADQAAWGFAMLRKAVEEGEGERGRHIYNVVLAGKRLQRLEASTVSIDVRAALLLSVLTWAQRCDAATDSDESQDLVTGSDSNVYAQASEPGTNTEHQTSYTTTSNTDKATSTGGTHGSRDTASSVVDTTSAIASDTTACSGGAAYGSRRQSSPTAVLGYLERVGRAVRVVVAEDGRLRLTVNRTYRAVSTWLNQARRAWLRRGTHRVLFFDTDDDASFRWLAHQLLRQGWIVRRVEEHVAPKLGSEGRAKATPILVHRCSDEKTLSVAADHITRGADGRSICVVVHRWDCGVEARHLLGRPAALEATAPGSADTSEVICTAEIGEDLFHYVRGQLQAGSTPEQVQDVLDNLLGCFYEPARDS